MKVELRVELQEIKDEIRGLKEEVIDRVLEAINLTTKKQQHMAPFDDQVKITGMGKRDDDNNDNEVPAAPQGAAELEMQQAALLVKLCLCDRNYVLRFVRVTRAGLARGLACNTFVRSCARPLAENCRSRWA